MNNLELYSQKPKSYQHRRARPLYCSTSQKHLKCRDARLPHLTLSFLWSIALKLEIRVTYITPNKFAYVSRDCSVLARNAADAFLHNCLFTCLIEKARLLLPLLAGIYSTRRKPFKLFHRSAKWLNLIRWHNVSFICPNERVKPAERWMQRDIYHYLTSA